MDLVWETGSALTGLLCQGPEVSSGIVTLFPGLASLPGAGAQEGLCCYGSVGETKEGLGAVDFDRFTSLLWSLLTFHLAFAFMTFRALSRKPAEKMNFSSTGGSGLL